MSHGARAAFVAACITVALNGCGEDENSAYIKDAETYFQQALKDPGSVQLDRIEVKETLHAAKVVCGRVNAKNSFGGYVGWQPFFFDGIDAVIGDNKQILKVVEDVCNNKGTTLDIGFRALVSAKLAGAKAKQDAKRDGKNEQEQLAAALKAVADEDAKAP